MPAKTPEEEVREIKERRPGAVEALIREHAAPLLAGALGLGFSRADAEELVQDSLAAFISGIERFEGRSRLKTYLFGILYNKASELRRRQRREEPSAEVEAIFQDRFDVRGLWISPPAGPEEAALTREVRAWIEKCADGLPLSQRAAFFLKEAEGQTPEEVCNILGVSSTNLRVLMHRARLKLRECLERYWGGGHAP